MQAIAINGSPRKGGNTEVLLRKVLEPLTAAGWEAGLIQLGGMPIQGCRACYQCFKANNARCGQQKDMFNECMRPMVEADAIIPGPTYCNLGFGLDQGEVKRDEEGLRNMRDLAESIAWLGKAIQQCADSPPRLVQSELTP